jgi:hypothetical protein
MVQKKMFRKIKNYKKKGFSKKRTAKDLKIARKTVRKYWNMSTEDYLKYLQNQTYRFKAFDDLKSEILKIYEVNNNKKLQMSAVYDFLEEKYDKLPAKEKSLRNYIHYLIETNEIELKEQIRTYSQVPELPFGQQLQIDFGEYVTKSKLKLYIFAGVLSASRYKYIALQDTPFTSLSLIEHLLSCFDYFGGMPEELVIDQDSVIVTSENHGDILFTKNFNLFKEEMGLEIYTCRKADPESKGKIENVIKFVKGNFFSVRDFEDLEDASVSLSNWLVRRGNGKISQATRKIPASVFKEEKKELRPLKNSIFRKDSLISRENRSVNDKLYLSYNSSQYSVPNKYRNKDVDIYPTEQKLFVFDKNTGEQIACHNISIIPGKKVIDREHFRETATKASALKEEIMILVDTESWREFAQLNFKTFQRYVRDQCILAKKHFAGELNLEVIKKALSFCLENKTYSYSNLSDTYIHFLNIHNDKADIKNEPTNRNSIPRKAGPVKVATRNIGFYSDYVKQKDEVLV